jgi:hypothetical protein
VSDRPDFKSKARKLYMKLRWVGKEYEKDSWDQKDQKDIATLLEEMYDKGQIDKRDEVLSRILNDLRGPHRDENQSWADGVNEAVMAVRGPLPRHYLTGDAIARLDTCPRCGVPGGQKCRTSSGKRTSNHTARFK